MNKRIFNFGFFFYYFFFGNKKRNCRYVLATV
jgi:hypothetical protein